MTKPTLGFMAVIALAAASLTPAADAGARQRLLPYNGLDRTFGGGAVRLPGTRAFPESTANSCVPGPSGEVFVELTTRRYVSGRRGRKLRTGRVQLLKVSADGVPIRRFGKSGRVSWSERSRFRPAQISVDAAGRPLILSHPPDGKTYPKTRKYVLSRLTKSGRGDRSFGIGGRIELGRLRDAQVTVLPNRRIVVASGDQNGTRLLVLDESGPPDPRFGAGQPVIVNTFFPALTSVKSGLDSIIVAAGLRSGPAPDYRSTAVAVFVGPDGSPAAVFGTSGELAIDSLPAAAAGPPGEPIPAGAVDKYVSHDFESVRATTTGGLDLVVRSATSSSPRGSSVWVRRLQGNGLADSSFGSGGDAFLFSAPGWDDLAGDEGFFDSQWGLVDDSWLVISVAVLSDHPTIPAGDLNLYFSTTRLTADGKLRSDTGFDRAKHPTGASDQHVEPTADGKSIVWCGHTGYKSRGRPHVNAWVARAPIERN